MEILNNQYKNDLIAWPQDYIDAKIQYHIDMQTIDIKACNTLI